jgi:hypothetical protein
MMPNIFHEIFYWTGHLLIEPFLRPSQSLSEMTPVILFVLFLTISPFLFKTKSKLSLAILPIFWLPLALSLKYAAHPLATGVFLVSLPLLCLYGTIVLVKNKGYRVLTFIYLLINLTMASCLTLLGVAFRHCC